MVGKRRQIRTLGLALSALFLSGCAGLTSYNPATGKNELILISVEEENALGLQSHKELMQTFQPGQDKQLWAQLNRIGPRIAAVSDRQDYTYQFFVVESDDFNAFTTPGGYVYVHSGLMKALKTDDRIAGVVAHEVGHCAAKHVAKKYQKALGYNLIYSVAIAAAGDSARSIVELGSGTVMKLAMSAYSRQDEYEADRLGVKYTTLAGYNPNALLESFEIMQAAEGGGMQTPTILRSHPQTKDRITALKREIATAGKYRKSSN